MKLKYLKRLVPKLFGIGIRPHKLKPILSREEVLGRIWEIAEQIVDDFEGEELTMVYVLQGAFIYATYLGQAIQTIKSQKGKDFIFVSSNVSAKSRFGVTTLGLVWIKLAFGLKVKGKDILVVEDIVDSGITLNWLCKKLKRRGAESVKITALFSKPEENEYPVEVDYLGFKVKGWVVGWGLDWLGLYRFLTYLAEVVFLDSE